KYAYDKQIAEEKRAREQRERIAAEQRRRRTIILLAVLALAVLSLAGGSAHVRTLRQKNRIIAQKNEENERLLLNILPGSIAGRPVPRADHAETMAAMALDMLGALEEFNVANGTSLNLRIGVNTGPVVAGVIGRHKFIYDLWGDAVNTAARMESHGVANRVHL